MARKERASIIIDLEYDPDNSATIEQLLAAIKEGIHVDFNTDHCTLLDAFYSLYSIRMICPQCGEWVSKRPLGLPVSSIQHKDTCSYYEKDEHE